jgi:hypothetical protein
VVVSGVVLCCLPSGRGGKGAWWRGGDGGVLLPWPAVEARWEGLSPHHPLPDLQLLGAVSGVVVFLASARACFHGGGGERGGWKDGGAWFFFWEFCPAACWRRAPSPHSDPTVVGQPSRLLHSILAGVSPAASFKWCRPRSSGGGRAGLPRRIWRRWCLGRIAFCFLFQGPLCTFLGLACNSSFSLGLFVKV